MSSTAVSPKVTVPVLAGALTTLLTWFAGMAGIEVPAEVSAAVTVLIMGGIGWVTRDPARVGVSPALHPDEG